MLVIKNESRSPSQVNLQTASGAQQAHQLAIIPQISQAPTTNASSYPLNTMSTASIATTSASSNLIPTASTLATINGDANVSSLTKAGTAIEHHLNQQINIQINQQINQQISQQLPVMCTPTEATANPIIHSQTISPAVSSQLANQSPPIMSGTPPHHLMSAHYTNVFAQRMPVSIANCSTSSTANQIPSAASLLSNHAGNPGSNHGSSLTLRSPNSSPPNLIQLNPVNPQLSGNCAAYVQQYQQAQQHLHSQHPHHHSHQAASSFVNLSPPPSASAHHQLEPSQLIALNPINQYYLEYSEMS